METYKLVEQKAHANYFIHLSDLIGIKVFHDNIKHGKIVDVAASLSDVFPNVHGFIIKISGISYYVPMNDVINIEPRKKITLKTFPQLTAKELPINTLFLKKSFWDKQIVDVSGAKVVRVNDLHLLRDNNELWVVHIDIGFDSLMRRLGFLSFIQKILTILFDYTLKEKIISWKHIQTPNIGNEKRLLHLNQSYTKLSKMLPQDLADVIEDLGHAERLNLVKILNIDTLADTILELPKSIAMQILNELETETICNLINAMPNDDAIEILEYFSRKESEEIFSLLPRDKKSEINALLQYKDDTAGSIMNSEFVSCDPDILVCDVISNIRSDFSEVEIINYVYLTNPQNILVGVSTLRKLLLAEPNQKIKEISEITNVISLDTDTKIDDVIKLFVKYKFLSIPVVDEKNEIKGVVNMIDALENSIPEFKKQKKHIFA